MGRHEERRQAFSKSLADIDKVLGESGVSPFRPVTVEEVKDFKSLVKKNGIKKEKDELISLEEAVVQMVLKKSSKEYLRPFKKRLNELAGTYQKLESDYPAGGSDNDFILSAMGKAKAKSNLTIAYDDFRGRVLSHVLSTPPDAAPEDLRGDVAGIRERYIMLEQLYSSRQKPFKL